MDRRQFVKLSMGVGLATTAAPLVGAPAQASVETAAASSVVDGKVTYYGAFREVKPDSVTPSGWLLQLLQRQAGGLAKNHAVQGFPFNTNLWDGTLPANSNPAKSWIPYEQTGYLVDGLERLALVTGDQTSRATAKASIDYILGHPQGSGTLGPAGVSDMYWPHNVVFRALQAEYAATGDQAIPTALLRHYLAQPSDYGHSRDVTNVEHMLRVYAATGDSRMLAMATHTYDVFNSDNPKTSLTHLASASAIVEHGVTFNETAKVPALIYLYTGEQSMLDAAVNAYRKIDTFDMLPDGLHSSEENLRGNDVGLYHETCNVSDYTYSVGYLLMASGDATWADHIERCVFNAGLGSISKDFTALQYFSTPNQVKATKDLTTNVAVDRVAYRPGHDTQCCSANVERFLPNYALRQWLIARDGGVVAALYGPSTLSTTVAGSAVTIEQQTSYPFSEEIDFVVHTAHAVSFPFYLRIPGWASAATLTVNGTAVVGKLTPGTFVKLQRTFADGDRIVLQLPMAIRLPSWPGGGVSVERGPLLYVLHIEENAVPVQGYDTTAAFPAWEITPASAWSYALALSGAHPETQFTVIQRTSQFPWDTADSPVELRGPGVYVNQWRLPATTNPTLPTNPQFSATTKSVRLVPYGSTRIRLAVFPVHRT